MSILKWNWVQVSEDDARIIDNNELLEKRLSDQKTMTPISLVPDRDPTPLPEGETGEEMGDYDGFSPDDDLSGGGFQGGLDFDQLDEIPGDMDDGSTLIKAAPPMGMEADMPPMYDGPSPQDLIEDARIQVDEMYREAREDIERSRQEAMEAARAQGQSEGYARGMEQAEAELAAARQQLEAEYNQKMKELEPEFVKQLCGIYEHIFHVQLSDYQNIVIRLLENCMQKMEGSTSYVVRVSPEDYPFVSMQKKVLIECMGSRNSTLEVAEDSTLKKNECMIETDGGIFDCSLDAQLYALRKDLVTMSYQGED